MKKTYVQKLYASDLVTETIEEEVSEREPMNIKTVDDPKLIGFRFYDLEYDKDNQQEAKKTNYSIWYFIGKRWTLEQIEEKYGKRSKFKNLIASMHNLNFNYACQTQLGEFYPIKDEDMTFTEYVNQIGKEKIAKKMYDNLEKHIGEKIIYKSWWYGRHNDGTSILKDVSPFFNIAVDGFWIPFIGYGSAIKSIELEETGEILFYNPYVEDYYDLRTDEELERVERKFYGDRYTDDQKAKREEAKRKREEERKKADEAAKASKPRFIEEGKALVKPETVDEWIKFVDINCDDAYSSCVVKGTLFMMKKFEEGLSFEEADKAVDDEFGLTGFLAGAIAQSLAHFAKQGEEYRQYWNKQFGVEPEEKGTVNPAIINISRK